MININGKSYKINLDIRWGIQKLMRKMTYDLSNPENDKYVDAVIKELLIPTPTSKEMFNFKQSDIEGIFNQFAEEIQEKDKELKKKLSN